MFDNFWGRFWKTLSENFHFLGEALYLTLIISFCGFIIGLVIATLFAISMTYQKPGWCLKILNKCIGVFIWLIRGIPIVVLLLLMYFVFLVELRLNATVIAVFVFSLYGGAYMTEILRGAINSIDKGQLEAGRALGLSNWFVMFKIVLPQAFKNAVQSLGNILIIMVKNTSVVSFITVIDLTKATQLLVISTYDVVVPYILLAIIYLVLVGLITLGIKFVEKVVFRYAERKV
jgi:polar amino acid transport system permease protein